MTNEEIIGQLEWVRKRISDITYSPESFEAINSAIEAVKKQDEILENNKNLCKHCEELKEENKMLSDVKENLEKKIEFLMQQIRLWQSWASTEQQGKDCEENMDEQETFGEWERIDKWVDGIYCGGFIHKDCPMIKVSDDCYYSPWKYRYCPNCGKKMNKEAENDL